MPTAADTQLYATVRELFAIAEGAGKSAEWLDAAADRIVAALNELAALRLNCRDPRRAKSLENAKRVMAMLAACERADYSVTEARESVRERLGLSVDKFYRLVRLAEELHEVPQLVRESISSSSRSKHEHPKSS